METNTLFMVHKFLADHVKPGDSCIDATAGKGRDTLLLAQLVGEKGSVLSMDIQEVAIDLTKKLLLDNNLTAQCVVDSHANMDKYRDSNSVDAIVFNFGRLPGGDPNIMTRVDSSIEAIRKGLDLLKINGVMAIALYYGGPNGYSERDGILEYLSTLDDKAFDIFVGSWINRKNDPPFPIFIKKNKDLR